MKVRDRLFGCPVELTLTMIGGKWKTIILARLKEAPMRYSELRRALPDLADKVLTQRLHELEEVGFIVRGRPGRDAVAGRYALTDYGRSLAPALQALYAWGRLAGAENGARFRPQRLPLASEDPPAASAKQRGD